VQTGGFNGAFSSGGLVFSTAGSGRIQNVDATSTVPTFSFNGDSNTGIGSSALDELSLIAGGVEAARFTTGVTFITGNLGVGIDTPSRNLSVAGIFGVENSGGDEYLYANATSNGIDYAIKDSGGTISFRIDDRGGAEKMYYNGVGNVGIGTISPAYKMHVIGDAYIDTWLYCNNFYPKSSTQNMLFNTGTGKKITFNPASGTTIFSTGNVGIGTEAPVYKLEISGTSNTTGIIYSAGTPLETIISTLSVGSEDTTRVQGGTNISTGGTANNPTINLDDDIILGSISATTISATTKMFLPGGGILTAFIGDEDTGIASSGTNALAFKAGGATMLYINSTGFRFPSGKKFANSGTGNPWFNFLGGNPVGNSATNYFEIENAPSGGTPTFRTAGNAEDDVNFNLGTKGSGIINLLSPLSASTINASGLTINQAVDNSAITVYGFDDKSGSTGTFSVGSDGNVIFGATGHVKFNPTNETQFTGGLINVNNGGSGLRLNDGNLLKLGTGSDYSIGYSAADDSLQIIDGSVLDTNVR